MTRPKKPECVVDPTKPQPLNKPSDEKKFRKKHRKGYYKNVVGPDLGQRLMFGGVSKRLDEVDEDNREMIKYKSNCFHNESGFNRQE